MRPEYDGYSPSYPLILSSECGTTIKLKSNPFRRYSGLWFQLAECSCILNGAAVSVVHDAISLAALEYGIRVLNSLERQTWYPRPKILGFLSEILIITFLANAQGITCAFTVMSLTARCSDSPEGYF